MRRAVLNMRDERPAWAPPATLAERIRARLGDEWTLSDIDAPVSGRGDGGGASTHAIEAIRGAEIYFGYGLPREVLAAGLEGGRLRWIHTGSAGVGSLLHPELTSSDIILTNSAGIHAEPMAETVIGMMLHFAHGLHHAVRAQQRGEWNAAAFEALDSGVREIAGATVGLVGFGGIGRAVARRADALGMRVLATRRSDHGDGAGSVEMLTGAHAINELLERSDFVVITVPSTPRTRGMIDGARLARMQPGAVLINVARGDIVDEAALVQALRERRIGGAALDVFTREPLPSSSPLWEMDNVLITPHVSATTPRYWERELELILENVDRYHAGTPLRNTVDYRAGY